MKHKRALSLFHIMIKVYRAMEPQPRLNAIFKKKIVF